MYILYTCRSLYLDVAVDTSVAIQFAASAYTARADISRSVHLSIHTKRIYLSIRNIQRYIQIYTDTYAAAP